MRPEQHKLIKQPVAQLSPPPLIKGYLPYKGKGLYIKKRKYTYPYKITVPSEIFYIDYKV